MTGSDLLDLDPPPRQPTTHPIIKSIGGKWYWRSRIIPLFPPRTREVVSPFLGGGAVELALAASGVRVHGSDLLYPLVCAWNLLLTRPETAAAAMLDYNRTYCGADSIYTAQPTITAANLRTAKESLFGLLADEAAPEVIGGVFLGLNHTTYNGILSGGPRSITHSLCPKYLLFNDGYMGRVRRFYAPLMASPVLHRDYRATLDAHGDIFAYLDPPYHLGEDQALYGVSGELHRDFDHAEFADRALAHRGGCLISYDDRPEIRALYEGRAEIHEIKGRHKGRRVRPDDWEDDTEIVIPDDDRWVNPIVTELLIRRMPR